ncbi:MAG: 3-oxoacyl-ACP synthase [Calothrix sp. SM1_7_51]|nr:3-oxoacyl-ACP synthase [Calothrix sp. SM1_7_51]
MIDIPVGIRSLSVSFPSIIRTNKYWQEKYPNLFAQVKPRKKRVSRSLNSNNENNSYDIWSQAVTPYLSDPFRGNMERRVLATEESSLILEFRAATDALEVAQMSLDEVELMIVTSLFPEHIGPGNASYLAQKLKLQCPAWNLESTCSSALVALQNAQALVQNGTYRNVLVVVSHIGSNTVDEEDTLSWSMGDAAGAFLVGSLKPTQGILGTKVVNTAVSCGAYSHQLVVDAGAKPKICTRTGDNANILAETAVDFVRTCTYGALEAAGVTLEDINFFVFNTPTAWYLDVCVKGLEIDPERVINIYPRYANIGPVYPIANLYHAVESGKINSDDLVLVYTNGAGSTAVAMVMRWGDVSIGQAPSPPLNANQQQERIDEAREDMFSDAEFITLEKISISRDNIIAFQPSERQQMLESYIIQLISQTLKISVNELNSQQSLRYLIDSLVALEIRKKIDSDLLIQVPMIKFLQDNTVAEIAQFLNEKLSILELDLSKQSSSEVEEDEYVEEILI